MRMDGGGTDLGAAAGAGAEAEAGAAEDEPVPEGTSGLSLMVFLAAEEAEAALGETGTLFRAAVSVLRIFTGSFTPPGALLSVSAMINILFEKQKLFFYDSKYSIQTGEGKSKKEKNGSFLEKSGRFAKKMEKNLDILRCCG